MGGFATNSKSSPVYCPISHYILLGGGGGRGGYAEVILCSVQVIENSYADNWLTNSRPWSIIKIDGYPCLQITYKELFSIH